MIYTSSDIIKKAEQAADLQNSDFISWYEKMSLLNDSYEALYQKLVNSGDMSFVKRVPISSGETSLPDDFWQIRNLYTNCGENGAVLEIPRRSASSSFSSASYEILNNTLYIYGTYMGSITLEYYTAPCDLLVRPEESDIATVEEEVLGIYGIHAITTHDVIEQGGNLNVENLKTLKNVPLGIKLSQLPKRDTSTYSKNVICGENGFAIRYSDDGGGTYLWHFRTWNDPHIEYSSNLGTLSSRTPILFDTGEIGFIYWGFPLSRKVYIGTTFVGEYTLDANLEYKKDMSYIVSNKELDTMFILNNDGTVAKIEQAGFPTISSEGSSLHANVIRLNGDCLWFGSEDCYGYVKTDSIQEVIQDNEFSNILTFDKFDYNTGLAPVAKDVDSSYYRVPFVKDSVLEFPNTFYYQLLSLMLAVQFKIKQGADISLLNQQLASYWDTFYDTLSRDANDFIRIKNIY